MKIHLEEQTVEVEAGAILVRFNVVEEVAPAPVEAPVEGAPEESVETPVVEVSEEVPVTEAPTV